MPLDSMVRALHESGFLRSKRVEGAMLAVDRALFTPPGSPPYDDRPLHIARGQTISAPGVVAFMLDMLEVEDGMKVLEVGAGSGYNAALLSRLVGDNGKVVTFEIVPELYDIARANLAKIGPPKNVELHPGDGSAGYPDEAPYDRIIVTCGMPSLDGKHPLVRQLKEDGRLIAPVGGAHFQDLVLYDKSTDSYQKVLPVMFVPMRGEKGFHDGV